MVLKIKTNNTFVKIQDSMLETEIERLEIYFRELLKKIGLENETWSQINFFELEKKKSIIRGLLRESKHSYKILKQLKQAFKNSDFSTETIKFYTKLYPMIHLPNDKSESVGLHFDNFGNKEFFTSWTAITNYKYPALSYIKNSQNFKKLISKFLIKFKILNLFLSNINIQKGEIYIWNGNMIHKGNLNTSKDISAAFQIKFTDENFIHEESLNLKDELENQYNLDFKLEDLIDKYNKLINFGCKIDNILKIKENKIDFYLNKSNNIEKKIISFSLSVLAQRIFTSNFPMINAIKKEDIIKNLDLISIIFGGENLSSIHRLNRFNNKEIDEFLGRRL